MSFLLPPLPPKFDAALRDVHGKRPESRVAAAERLGRADPEQRAQALEGLLILTRDAHPSVRATALASLGSLADDSAVEAVLDAVRDPAPEVRELAVIAASQIGGERALSAIREALHSEFPEVRFQAISAVAEMAPQDATAALIPLVADADDEVRAQALAGLAALDAPHLVGHFAGALEDASPAVRVEAALALSMHQDARGETVLLDALARRDRVLEVADALARIGSKRAIEPLARMAERLFASPYIRAASGAALVRLGDSRGIRALQRVLTAFRADARSYAVDLVRETQTRELVPELIRLSQRPRGADPLTVVDALATFAPSMEPARRALEQLAARTDDVGERARAALRL